MTDVAFEVFETWPVWEVPFSCKTKAAVQEPRCDSGAIITFNMPFMRCVVPSSGSDSSTVYRVLANVEHVVYMLEVLL